MKKRALKLAAAVLCASGVFAACSTATPEEMLSSAKTYLAKNDNKAAVLQLKNALQQKSDLAEARFLLGKALLASGEPVAAGVELRKALDLNYPQAEVAPVLANSLVALREFQKVIDQYDKVTLPDRAADANLKVAVATAHAAQDAWERARAVLGDVFAAFPDHTAAMILDARISMVERRFDKALVALDRVIALHPAEREALSLRADVLLFKGDDEGALQAYRKVLTVEPLHLGAQVGVIDRLLGRRDIDAAKVEIEQLRKLHPNHPQTHYYEAQLAYVADDIKRAGELVEKALKVQPNNAKALELAGAIELKQQALLRASDYFGKALQLNPGLLASRRLLAQTYLQLGQPEKALAALEPLMSRGVADAPTLTLAATAEAQAGNMKRAEALIVRAAKLEPDSVRSRVTLVLDRSRDGSIDTALGEIETIAAADTGPYADFVLVNAHLRRGEFDKALKSIDAIARKQPDKPFAANLRGRIHILRKDTAAARRSFEQALAIDPKFVPAAASLALLDLADKKPDQAKKRLEAVLAADPKSVQAMLALAGLHERTGAPKEEVRKLFLKARDANPTDISPRLALVDHYLRHGDVKNAVTSAQEGAAALPESAPMIDALARAQLASGDRNQAVASFNKLVALQPGSPKPHLRIAGVHVEAKAYDEARRSVQRALALQPKSIAVQRVLADVEYRSGRIDEALNVARTIRKQAPADEAGYLVEGSIEASRKNLAAAADIYRAGLRQAPSTQLATRLHATLEAMKKGDEANRFAATWMKEHPQDARFVSFLGDLALSRRDYATAEGHLKRVDQMAPGNAVVLNNLAWVMAQLNKPGAVAYAEKANALAPGRPMFMDTLAVALASEKQFSRAIEIEKKAIALAPEAHGLRLSLAKLYIQAGDKTAARAELDQLAKLDAKFSGQSEVTRLLETL